MSENFLQLLKTASAIVIDVDGVLTDGSLFISESGKELRVMNIRDGYAINQAVKNELEVIVISGGVEKSVIKRLERLGVKHIHIGADDKKKLLKKLAKKLKLDLASTVYIGDDIPDLEAMKMTGMPCCPQDAVQEIISIAKYISPFGGGKGCVRDVIEKVLKLQGKWSFDFAQDNK